MLDPCWYSRIRVLGYVVFHWRVLIRFSRFISFEFRFVCQDDLRKVTGTKVVILVIANIVLEQVGCICRQHWANAVLFLRSLEVRIDGVCDMLTLKCFISVLQHASFSRLLPNQASGWIYEDVGSIILTWKTMEVCFEMLMLSLFCGSEETTMECSTDE